MKTKRTLAAIISAALLCQGMAAVAADKEGSIVLKIDDANVVVNGETIAVTAPFISNDITLVPLRVIAEGLGATVDWNGENKTVTVKKDDKEIVLGIGAVNVFVNGEEKTLEAAPQLKEDTTMLPIRFISEEMGAKVDWDGETRTVTVTGIAEEETTAQETKPEETDTESKALFGRVDNTKWQYNEEDDVYWQTGISYCANPPSTKYETMGIFVPGAYMKATKNTDGTYTCEINNEGKAGDFTALTAPIVIPVETPGYSAMEPPTGYVSGTAQYTKEGFVYAYAGAEGRNEGAPAGVTDLKAAIRYVRWNKDIIPGDNESIFTFGMSGGGAQSALVGATGDSKLYEPYLEAIGAVMDESDAVKGSMCWCPITNLDIANEAYEWNMGVTRSDLDEDTQLLSDGLADAFASYINEIKLKDEKGKTLLLQKAKDGSWTKGTYYDYVKSEIERSLNNFLADTTFPYTKESSKGGFGGGMPNFANGEKPDLANGEKPDPANGERPDALNTDDKAQSSAADETEAPTATEVPIEELDGITRTNQSAEPEESKTYKTAQEYIDDLNGNDPWITYNKRTNKAKISSIEAFVKACKNASKAVGAFDALDASQGENILFGMSGEGWHFDPIMAKLLENSEYAESYNADIAKVDSFGTSVGTRVNMYTPMYYIDDMYDGYKTSEVAKYWRIRTGINQGDTALSTEINLALALKAFGADVDFETVWGEGHTKAERTGSSDENFIEWVKACMK